MTNITFGAMTQEQFETVREQFFRANPPEVMNAGELATYLGVGLDTVRAKTQEGEIPFKSIGKRIVYPLPLIREWLQKKSRRAS